MGQDFDDFFRENYPPVVGALALVLDSYDAAQDAAQHGFLQALKRWRKVNEMDNPVGWVFVVAVRFGRKTRTLPTGEVGETDLGEHSTQVIDRALLADAVDELTPRQRSVFVLRHVAELSTVEISEALGVTSSTVRVLDHQARARLRAVLGADYDSEANTDAT